MFNGIVICVVFKNIKHVYLQVIPPKGDVQLKVPLFTSEAYIYSFLTSKEKWIINKQQASLSKPMPIMYKYQPDEIHYFNGKSYTLQIKETQKKQHVTITQDKFMTLWMKKNHTIIQREKIIQSFYRNHLIQLINKYVSYWQPIMKVEVSEIGIKRMKTKWGTCNIITQKIWLNLALAKKSAECVEYVVVHEMVHLLERYHNQRFKSFMTQFLPKWKTLQKQLNQ